MTNGEKLKTLFPMIRLSYDILGQRRIFDRNMLIADEEWWNAPYEREGTMQIIYTCPKCGADIQEIILTTNPPIHRKQCMSCGWSYTDTDREDILRIPFEPPTEYKAESEV